MNIRTIALATILATGIPVAVQAQETNDLQNYQVSCKASAECSNFNVNYEQEGDQVAQIRRTRTRRTRSSSLDSKYYAGGTLGLFFPGDIEDTSIDPGTGFGGSVYGGYNFTEQISADAEFVINFAGNDIDQLDGSTTDGSYTSYAFFVNPRFSYAFNQGEDDSPYVFASPGVGFGHASVGGDVGDDLEAEGFDNSGSGFAIQGKAGVGYPITDKLDVIGQGRYMNIFNVIDTPTVVDASGNTEEEGEGISTFAIEAGINYKF